MNVRAQPRALLGGVKGLGLRELPGRDVCCGFGGTFCVKYPEISNHMVADKCREIAESGADTVLAGVEAAPIGQVRAEAEEATA
jgi:L-lactate dehydrogenase complex protein LldE